MTRRIRKAMTIKQDNDTSCFRGPKKSASRNNKRAKRLSNKRGRRLDKKEIDDQF